MTTEQVALVVSALGGGAIIREVLLAVLQRRKVGIDGAAVLAAAAADLVEPLRKELAAERAEHADEIAEERRRVAALRAELDAATVEAHRLAAALALARVDVEALTAQRQADKRRIRALEDALDRQG